MGMTREEIEMRTLVRESDVIDRTDGSELAKAFNTLWEKYIEQEPCEDAISRQTAIDVIERWLRCSDYNDAERHIMRATQSMLYDLQSVNPQPKTDTLDKIRAEIEQNAYPIVHGVNNHELGMTLYGILQIIDKYKSESEG